MQLYTVEKTRQATANVFVWSLCSATMIMFSTCFPTGFHSTLYGLTTVWALLLAFFKPNSFWQDMTSMVVFKSCALFFLFAGLSFAWSEATIREDFVALFEYRFFVLLPLFFGALSQLGGAVCRQVLTSAYIGSMFALGSSYALFFGWLEVPGATFSLANSIYHGFVIAILFGVSFFLCLNSQRRVMACFFGSVVVLCFVNLVYVEQGRTAYVLLALVSLFCLVYFVAVFGFNLKAFIVLVFMAVLVACSEAASERVQQTISDVVFFFEVLVLKLQV